MATVYSVRLFSVGGLAVVGPLPFYTVPVGIRAVVHTMSFVTGSNPGGANAYVLGPGNAKLAWASQPSLINIADTEVFTGRWVLEAGEKLLAAAPSGTWDIWASGYELALP